MNVIETDLFAFYGSLRRGMENHFHFANSIEYLSTYRLAGYELYSLGDYPYAVKTIDQNQSILIEIFSVTDNQTRNAIHKMEIEAGYFLDQIMVAGRLVSIYLYENKGNDPKVNGGDWVEFFGKERK